MSRSDEPQWYAVRCVFAAAGMQDGATTYEERITLWQADGLEAAIARAEDEAREYAAAIEESPVTYAGLAQAFHLFDEPGDGAEIFSLMRDSNLDHQDYLDEFFDTGNERESNL